VSAKMEALQRHERLLAEYEQRMQHLATRTDLPAYIWREHVRELFDVHDMTITNWINYGYLTPQPGTEGQFSRGDVQRLALTYRKTSFTKGSRPRPRQYHDGDYYRSRPASASPSNTPAAERRQRILNILIQGELSIPEIAAQLQPITTNSINNDLKRLYADGKVYRRPGRVGNIYYWGRT